jgi:hypothetical protein
MKLFSVSDNYFYYYYYYLFIELLIFEFPLSISETFLCSAADAVYRYGNIFGITTVSLNYVSVREGLRLLQTWYHNGHLVEKWRVFDILRHSCAVKNSNIHTQGCSSVMLRAAVREVDGLLRCG